MPDPQIKQIGPFEVIQHLHKATLGDVLLCRRVGTAAKDSVPLIVKTFRPDLVEMRKEIEVLERPLHRCMIQYRQVGFDVMHQCYFTAMDRLNAEPHSAALMRRTNLGLRDKINRFIGIGEALAKLHDLKDRERQPLFHGALKPSNILVRMPDKDYHMLVTDFGFLYKFDAKMYTESHTYFETWLFQPPEVILHAVKNDPTFMLTKAGAPPPPCPASDVYSWVLIMVYSLNGGRDGFYYVLGKTSGDDKYDDRVRDDVKVLYQKKLDVADRWNLVVNKKSEFNTDLFVKFVFKALSPDPRDRYENMTAALEAFRSCLA